MNNPVNIPKKMSVALLGTVLVLLKKKQNIMIRVLSVILGLALVVTLNQCKKKPKGEEVSAKTELLVKSPWHGTEYREFVNDTLDYWEDYSYLILTFKKDGTYETLDTDFNETTAGTWEWVDNETAIHFSVPGEEDFTLTLGELTENRLFMYIEENTGDRFRAEMEFVRN